MAATVFDNFIYEVFTGSINPSTAVYRVALEEDASTLGTPSKSLDYVGDLAGAGFVEVTAAGYSRKTLGNVQVAIDAVNHRVELTADPSVWSALASGEEVKGAIIYVQTGGDDTTPNNDPLVMHLPADMLTGLPMLTNGGSLTITWHADGVYYVQQG